MDVNLAAMAGAVVSGSHVGLFFSPMADNFNLVVSVTKTDSLTVMKRAAYIGIPTFAACIIFIVFWGFSPGQLILPLITVCFQRGWLPFFISVLLP